MSTTPKDEKPKLTNEEIEKALLKQIDFYFSIENLSKDTFLVSQMEPSTSYVPLSTIAKFKRVNELTTNIELIQKVVKNSSKNAELSDDGTKIKPNMTQSRRTTLILRDLAENVTKKDIDELIERVFVNDAKVNKPLSLTKDIGNTWFCKFNTEQQTMKAFKILREQKLRDKNFGVRIKSENPLVQLLAKNNVTFSKTTNSNNGGNNRRYGQGNYKSGNYYPTGQQGKHVHRSNYYPNQPQGVKGRRGKYNRYNNQAQQGGSSQYQRNYNHAGVGSGNHKKNRKNEVLNELKVLPEYLSEELKSGYPEDVKVIKYTKRDFIETFDKLYNSTTTTTTTNDDSKKEEDTTNTTTTEVKEKVDVEQNQVVKSNLKRPEELENFTDLECVLEKPNTSLELTKPYLLKTEVVSSSLSIKKPTPKNAIYVVGGENLVKINERNLITDRPTTPGKKSFAEAAITARDVKTPKIERSFKEKQPLSSSKKNDKVSGDNKPKVRSFKKKYEKKNDDSSSNNNGQLADKKKKKKKIIKKEESQEQQKKEDNQQPQAGGEQQNNKKSKKKRKKNKKRGDENLQKSYAKVENKSTNQQQGQEKKGTIDSQNEGVQNEKTYASIVQMLKKKEETKTTEPPKTTTSEKESKSGNNVKSTNADTKKGEVKK